MGWSALAGQFRPRAHGTGAWGTRAGMATSISGCGSGRAVDGSGPTRGAVTVGVRPSGDGDLCRPVIQNRSPSVDIVYTSPVGGMRAIPTETRRIVK